MERWKKGIGGKGLFVGRTPAKNMSICVSVSSKNDIDMINVKFIRSSDKKDRLEMFKNEKNHKK